MIRPLTCLCALAALGSGLYLYQSKHAAQLLDKQIEKTAHEAEATREQTRVLQAEWTLLSDPERLRQFADQYLSLKPLQPAQFTSLADLDQRLPTPRAEAPPTPPVAANVPIAVPPQRIAGAADPQATAAATDEPDDAIPLPPVPPSPPGVTPIPAWPIRIADPKPVAPRAPVRQMAEIAPLRPPVASDLHPVVARPQEVRPAELRPSEPRIASGRPPIQAAALPQAQRAFAPSSAPPVTGSLLGMAHGSVPTPMPVPIPRPTPVNAAQWANGN